MMFIKCSDFHQMCCVAWKQEYTYIHAYAAFQTQMYLAGLYLPLSWTVTATIKIASECVLISTTVKFLLKKRQSKLLVHSTIKWPVAMFLKWLPHPVKQEWYWCHIQIHLLSQAVWLMVLMLFTFTYIPLVNMQRTKKSVPKVLGNNGNQTDWAQEIDHCNPASQSVAPGFAQQSPVLSSSCHFWSVCTLSDIQSLFLCPSHQSQLRRMPDK